MSVGGAATGRSAGGVAPWPNAAERAAARCAAQEALARSRVRREAQARDAAEAVADVEEPIAPLAARPRIEDDESLLGRIPVAELLITPISEVADRWRSGTGG